MAEPNPSISVVVSSRNRAALLPKLVAALEHQTLPLDRFEVVIVDDGSTDATNEVLRDLERDTPLRLRSIRRDRSAGPAAGRNAGWRTATAPIVAFTDDDCEPQPRWLEAGLAALETAPIVVGRTVPDPAARHLLGPFARSMRVEDATWLATCNVFYRRSDLEAVGGFDEAYRNPGGEDTDLGWRLLDAGVEAAFAPEAVVHHVVHPDDFRRKVQETLRWEFIPRLAALHPARARASFYRPYFWRRSHPYVLSALCGLVLALALRRVAPILLAAPWVDLRMRRQPAAPGGMRRRARTLPGVFVIDALEVAVMVKGSCKQRTILL